MNRSESITHLASALAQAQAEMPVAVFDATNPFLKSKYASLGAVIQASRPILAKHRLSLVQFPISRPAAEKVISPGQPSPGPSGHPLPSDGRGVSPAPAGEGQGGGGDYIGVESILTHESGEFISERILIPLVEEKGKSRVQSAGSTLTYLRRYSWASILGMYSDEDSDGASPVQAFTAKAAPAGRLPGPTPPPPPVRKPVTQN